MKNSSELFNGLPKHDTVVVKVKGYRKFVADETKLRWICMKVANGEINSEDVTIIEKNGTIQTLTSKGGIKDSLTSNIFDLNSKLWFKVVNQKNV